MVYIYIYTWVALVSGKQLSLHLQLFWVVVIPLESYRVFFWEAGPTVRLSLRMKLISEQSCPLRYLQLILIQPPNGPCYQNLIRSAMCMDSVSIRDRARLNTTGTTSAGAWLRAIPNPNLGLSMSQHEFVKVWLGIPIFL